MNSVTIFRAYEKARMRDIRELLWLDRHGRAYMGTAIYRRHAMWAARAGRQLETFRQAIIARLDLADRAVERADRAVEKAVGYHTVANDLDATIGGASGITGALFEPSKPATAS